jgi:hypothetical protein
MSQEQCIDPAEIQEGDWSAYLHGDASPEVVRHVGRCAYCADQVEQMRMVDARLLVAFYRDVCPTPETLADLTLDRLPATEKLRVMAHVRRCPACAKEVDAVRGLTGEPPSLLERLRRSLALALTARPLVPATVPLRGRGWQGRFEADGWIITLAVQEGVMTGRVRGRKPSADIQGKAWLLSRATTPEAPVLQSRIDERGRFRFTALDAGTYALLLQVGGQDVAVETLQVE